jgi:hypothetical protein
MTLPASGTITLAQLRTEYTGPIIVLSQVVVDVETMAVNLLKILPHH